MTDDSGADNTTPESEAELTRSDDSAPAEAAAAEPVGDKAAASEDEPSAAHDQVVDSDGAEPDPVQPRAADPESADTAIADAESGTSEQNTSEQNTSEHDTSKPKAKKGKKKAPWWELPALIVGAIVLAILVKTFVLQPFYIPSQSMENTLYGCPGCSGDRILVNKTIYDFRDPHPGDIVVFKAPPGWDDEPGTKAPSNPFVRVVHDFGQLIGFVPPDGMVLVKRVIATGGQTVRGVVVHGKDEVQVSDHGTAGPWKTLNEPYVFEDGIDSHAAFGPVTVPKGRLWVMGDHRNDSADSRFHCGTDAEDDPAVACNPITSTVPNSDVIGKAIVIAWPPSRWRTLGTPPTFKGDS